MLPSWGEVGACCPWKHWRRHWRLWEPQGRVQLHLAWQQQQTQQQMQTQKQKQKQTQTQYQKRKQ